MLNQYLTNIDVIRRNLNVFHFNVVGSSAYDIHMRTGEWIKYFDDFYDRVAERIKMLGDYPITDFKEVMNVSTVKEIQSKDYTANETLNLIMDYFSLLNKMTKQIGEYAIKIYDLNTLKLVLDFNSYLDKNIWLNSLSLLKK